MDLFRFASDAAKQIDGVTKVLSERINDGVKGVTKILQPVSQPAPVSPQAPVSQPAPAPAATKAKAPAPAKAPAAKKHEYFKFLFKKDDSNDDEHDDFNRQYAELVDFFNLINKNTWNNNTQFEKYKNDIELIHKISQAIKRYKNKITLELKYIDDDTKFEETKIKFLKKLLNIILIYNILKKSKFEDVQNYIYVLCSKFEQIIKKLTITGDDKFISFFKYYIKEIYKNKEFKDSLKKLIENYNNFIQFKEGTIIKNETEKPEDKAAPVAEAAAPAAPVAEAAAPAAPVAEAAVAPAVAPALLNYTGFAGGGILQDTKKKIKYAIFTEVKELDAKLTKLNDILIKYNADLEEYKKIRNNEPSDQKYINLFKDFFDYSEEDIFKFFEEFLNEIKTHLIELVEQNEKTYAEIQNTDLKKQLKKYVNKSLYEKSFIFLKNQNVKEIQTYSKDKKESYKKILLKYDNLYNNTTGYWKADINDKDITQNDDEFKDKIKFYKDAYLKLKQLLDGVDLNDNYPDVKNLVDNINRISKKITNGDKVTEKDLKDLKEFKLKLKEIENSKPKGQDPEFDKRIAAATTTFEKMQTNEFNKKNITKLFTENKIIKDNEIYFDNYVTVFKYALRGLSIIGIVLLLGVVVLSLISLFLLIYYMILNLISLFINTNSTKNTSLDFIYKNIVKCTKENYSYDIFNILYEQSYSLALFQLGIYAVYLLLIYFLLYVFLVIYSSAMSYKFIGSLNEIDKNFKVLTMICIYVIYGFGHFMIYKLIFKKCSFIPYNDIQNNEKELDKLISSYIIISNSNSILIDDDFFEALYDSSRIEEINTLFYNGIITENKDNCLTQKIIIYNLYKYLREYIVFDDNIKSLFKEYCTSYEDKPLYTDGNNSEVPVTFISLLNNHEVKLIRKYHEDLPFYNNIPDDKLESFNKLNLSISEKIKAINMKIVNYKGTGMPFLFTIIYILIIVFYNIIFFYIILVIVVSDDKNEDFPSVITDALLSIKVYIFNPILDYFL